MLICYAANNKAVVTMNAFEPSLQGKSPELQAVIQAAQIVAATDVTVLIHGESGTGKELLAQALHASSRRSHKPFITINCAALPEALAESELFGHKRGAYTGAVSDCQGRVQAANGGTLLLDEIGELPLAIQAKLLRLLENGECQAVGETHPAKSDVRIIAATNRDLYAEVKAGRFREDLYYRLAVVPLELPPLRERHGDIPLLLTFLSQQAASRHGLQVPRFSPAAIALLQRHPWPGNVREMRNLCERLTILLPGKTIEPENLPPELRNPLAGISGNARASLLGGIGLEDMEVEMIRQALGKTQGNRSRAARLIGISRDKLLYRMKKYAIQG